MDRTRAQAARTREADIVGAQHLEHFRPHEAHDQRHLEKAERDGRHDQRQQPRVVRRPVDHHQPSRDRVAAPIGGQPAERHGEEVDEQDADEKCRQRDADEGDGLEDLGEDAVSPQRRIDAHQDAEDERKERRADGQLEGCRHALGQEASRPAGGTGRRCRNRPARRGRDSGRTGPEPGRRARAIGAPLHAPPPACRSTRSGSPDRRRSGTSRRRSGRPRGERRSPGARDGR